MTHWAVILAGGSGTRFWPLSTSRTPKQMLPLSGAEPLLVQSARRLRGLVAPEHTLVITGRALADATRALLPDIPAGNILVEPRAASTGPALAWATATAAARDADATVLSLHADWFVGDDEAFRRSAKQALEVAARFDVLVTVGIPPTRPDTGYGYIVPGEPLGGAARTVRQFVEKPDERRAGELIRAGALWNTGMFAWTAKRFLTEAAELAPEFSPHLPALERGDVEGFFKAVTPIAVDVSHYERSRRVAVVPGEFPWDDVGTWHALGRVRDRDAAGNVLVGDVTAVSARDSVAWAGDGPVVLFGVQDLVVVRANGMVLVTTRDHAASLKDLLAALPAEKRHLSA